jgi:hypothetical protein
MLNRIIFLFCLPIFFLGAEPTEENESKFSTGPAPTWVKPVNFELIPAKPSDIHYQYLLEETQVNWEEKTWYLHKAIKVLSQVGAEGFTQLAIDFDPAYQQVTIHAIRVLRDGETLNCLEKSRHKLLQKEEALEQNLYKGKFSLVYFLNDIRKGDIVEYSYSIRGRDPFFGTHLCELFYLQNHESKGKISYRLLSPTDTPLQVKSFQTSIEPKIVELSPTLREWSWEALETLEVPGDQNMPSWHNPWSNIQISQYKTWQEVAQKLLPLYVLPEDVEANPLPEMLSLVEKWTESTDDMFERATLALRFVQDEVKYMGFGDNGGNAKPADPCTVFERRFGHCNDKSILLQTLLKLMNISSDPVLVSTTIGKNLPEHLPGPRFDHAILRIEINGSYYWVDPVYTHQGGSLQNTYCPDYHWGLVISPKTRELTPIPSSILEKPIEIHTSIKLISPDTAELKVESIGCGFRADRMRLQMQTIGLKKYSDACLESAQKLYKGAVLLSPISYVDDREKNVSTITGHYKISTRLRLGKKLLKPLSAILEDYLDKNINLERSSPYAIAHPLWVKEHIHIENPFNHWVPDTEEAVFENEAIRYTYSMKKEGQVADFDFELKHLQDHVPVNLIQDYWNIVQEVDPNPSLELIISVPTPKS